MGNQLFISYRRTDSIAVVGRLYDRLVAEFGPENVFKDIDSIGLGDFRETIRHALAGCKVVLFVIGKTWLTCEAEDGSRRLDNPADAVRVEVEAALARSGLVSVPLLVDGAGMPKAEQLPESMRNLVFQNGFPVRHDPDFHGDVTRLIERLRAGVPDLGKASVSDGPPAPVNVAGFTFLGFETFSCPNDVEGERSFEMPVYQCDAFAQAAGVKAGTRAVDTEFVLVPPVSYGNAQPAFRGERMLVARTCVSQRVYEGSGGRHDRFDWPGALQPATSVSWYDVTNWLTSGDMAAAGLRLPSEAEWEFACRAGTSTAYCFGDGQTVTSELVNFNGNTPWGGAPVSAWRSRTVPVGSLPANAFGLHEVHGNLWEWCSDPWPANDLHRTDRGGSWSNIAASCRTSYRGSFEAEGRSNTLGVRPVRSVD
ncbi:MAG: SUMF1/EgtB/PvdO family nonheme iron enzyme [Planctomycetota bacterium]